MLNRSFKCREIERSLDVLQKIKTELALMEKETLKQKSNSLEKQNWASFYGESCKVCKRDYEKI